ncbi:thioredoxin family protein [Sunxiuqinia indica]|uniref:thioredoxin family protein n=1 Tax=Sunxiuqinia indica TaxID=2692584 RepID=UPI00135ABEC7|nr:thioredoxin family protein [Sunxiuqinia indica]
MKRTVEIFTAGCPVCEPVVKTVKEMVCGSCEVNVYNLVEQCDDKVCVDKMKEYNITSLPAVAVNGKLLSCCQNRGVSKEELAKAGIGQS